MKKTFVRWTLYVGIVALFLLHNDFWFWNNPKVVAGLPIGLLYHIGFCFAAAILMVLTINYAWPRHLQGDDTDE
ncbi:hypothetical protein J4G02_02150 [Candidatus Poribacteria bacterium]|nr:hypothetical protein [Candidatus Poribacteria bacterium]